MVLLNEKTETWDNYPVFNNNKKIKNTSPIWPCHDVLSTKDARVLLWAHCKWYVFALRFRQHYDAGQFFCSAAFVFMEGHSNAWLSTQVKYGNEDQHVDSLNAASSSSDPLFAKHPKAVYPPSLAVVILWTTEHICDRKQPLSFSNQDSWRVFWVIGCPHSVHVGLSLFLKVNLPLSPTLSPGGTRHAAAFLML